MCWQRTQPREETPPLCLLPATHRAPALCQPLPHTPALLPLPSTRLARPHLPGTPLLSHTPPLGQPPPNSTVSAPSGFLASGVFRGLARAAPLPVASFTHQSLGAPHVGLSYPRTLGRGSCGSSCLLPPIVTGSLAVETAWTFLELLGWREGNRMRARRGGKPRLALASARSRESPKHTVASLLACGPSTKWAPWAQCSLNPQKLGEGSRPGDGLWAG